MRSISARAREYALLATLLGRSPDALLLRRLAQLRGDATPLGLVHAALGEAAHRAEEDRVGREYFNLFIGLGRGELLPYASYYLTGFLYERPLARLRADLKRLGIEAAPGQSEPEDHAAILCEIMAALVGKETSSRRPGPTRTFLQSTWRLGSVASSPIWSARQRPIFTPASARWAEPLWTSKPQPLRFRPEATVRRRRRQS